MHVCVFRWTYKHIQGNDSPAMCRRLPECFVDISAEPDVRAKLTKIHLPS